MRGEVHSRIKPVTDTIIDKQTRRINDEEGHKRSLTTEKWRHGGNTYTHSKKLYISSTYTRGTNVESAEDDSYHTK